MLKKVGLLAVLLLGVSSSAFAHARLRGTAPALPSSALENSARRDARMAMALGDFRQRDPAQAKTEAGRRHAHAYNRTLAQERPYIIPGNPLEESLVALARTPSAISSQAFEQAFLTSKVYLVTTKEGQAAAQAGSGRFTFWRTPIGANAEAMAVFTSEDRVREALTNEREVHWIAMSGRDALRLGRGLPVAVNPGLRPPAFIQPAQAETLLLKTGGRS